jgi:CRP/FNR family cyclic AMP-dependent transcriptional regulator
MLKPTLLDDSPLFWVLSSHERRELIASAILRTFNPEQGIFLRGHRTDRIFVVERGKVRLSRTTPGGQEKFLRSVGRGYVLGQMSALDGSAHSVSAEALDQVVALSIPRIRYVAALEQHPKAAIALAGILANIVRKLSDELEAMKYASLESRLVAKLCERARGRREIRPITHAELADEAGGTRENVSRILGQLRNKGLLVLGRGWIEIRSHAGLEALLVKGSALP